MSGTRTGSRMTPGDRYPGQESAWKSPVPPSRSSSTDRAGLFVLSACLVAALLVAFLAVRQQTEQHSREQFEQGTRLVAIDNVHVILTASGVARRDTLDAFRFLMSAGNVPLVVAGLDVARQIFADDVELAYRSIILKLPLWEPGEPAQRLIRALARGMGMEEPDHLAEPAFAERIWRTSGGVTGNFKRILHWSGKVARRHDRRFVTQDDITEALQLFTPYSPE